MEENDIIMHKNRVDAPNSYELRKLVLKEMYIVPHVGILSYHKTIASIRSQYSWIGMKKDVANYTTKCMKCRRVKVEHRHPSGFLQPLPILEWKWKVVTIDFITKFSNIKTQHDSVLVVVEKSAKVAHFVLVKLAHKAYNIAFIYLK